MPDRLLQRAKATPSEDPPKGSHPTFIEQRFWKIGSTTRPINANRDCVAVFNNLGRPSRRLIDIAAATPAVLGKSNAATIAAAEYQIEKDDAEIAHPYPTGALINFCTVRLVFHQLNSCPMQFSSLRLMFPAAFERHNCEGDAYCFIIYGFQIIAPIVRRGSATCAALWFPIISSIFLAVDWDYFEFKDHFDVFECTSA